MGDFAAEDLWGVSYLTVGPEAPCQGCGGRIDADDRCYAVAEDIWHSGCWPYRGHVLRRHRMAANQWKPPLDVTATNQAGGPADRDEHGERGRG